MRALIGIDLRTTGHEWLLQRVSTYAAPAGAVIDLVHFNAQPQESHRARLDTLMSTLPQPQRGVVRLERAPAAEGLIRLSSDYDLLVVGSRAPRTLESLLLGSMATRIIRQARCAVLVPRGATDPKGPPKMLVGVDVNAPKGGAPLALATRWAEALGGKLDALYAVAGRVPHIADRAVRERAEREWLGLHEPERAKLQALLEAHVPEAARGQALVRPGEPEDLLVQLSRTHDLVLVGNRDRQGLAQLVLGTVAKHIVRNAESDVLSLPTA